MSILYVLFYQAARRSRRPYNLPGSFFLPYFLPSFLSSFLCQLVQVPWSLPNRTLPNFAVSWEVRQIRKLNFCLKFLMSLP